MRKIIRTWVLEDADDYEELVVQVCGPSHKDKDHCADQPSVIQISTRDGIEFTIAAHEMRAALAP